MSVEADKTTDGACKSQFVIVLICKAHTASRRFVKMINTCHRDRLWVNVNSERALILNRKIS